MPNIRHLLDSYSLLLRSTPLRLGPFLPGYQPCIWTSPRGPETKHLWPRSTHTQPGNCLSHSPFSQMYVRAAAERSLSGTPMHLLLVDAPNPAISMDEIFHAGLEPLRTFACLYPMDGILRASGERCRPMNGILTVTQRALSRINLHCATGSTAAYNSTSVLEQ